MSATRSVERRFEGVEKIVRMKNNMRTAVNHDRLIDYKECEWCREPDIHGTDCVFDFRASGCTRILWEEIIDGELLVTRAPHWQHQTICGNFYSQLQAWSQATGLGRACMGVGVMFSASNDVIPDVVWLSMEKYTALIDDASHVRGAPDLVIEVLSSGAENERRDRQIKLKLYQNSPQCSAYTAKRLGSGQAAVSESQIVAGYIELAPKIGRD